MASRKVALGAAAVGVYGITAVGSYYYMSGSRRAAAPPCSCCGGGVPFSKKSAAQYDKIASAYDAKISSDEFVMGVGLLRKHLIGSRGEDFLGGDGVCMRLVHQLTFRGLICDGSPGKGFGGGLGDRQKPGLLQVQRWGRSVVAWPLWHCIGR